MCIKIKSEKIREWIEEYSCGCSSSVHKKSELLGYCALHGNPRKNIILAVKRYKLKKKSKNGHYEQPDSSYQECTD